VYATEKIVIEDKDDKKVFHKACLKCSHCQKILSLGNYASMNGIMYCKPHFKQLFATKGNYDEGFGKEQHKKNWTSSPVSSHPASFVPVTSTADDVKAATSSPTSAGSKFKPLTAAEKCVACQKSVYATEKIVIEDKEDKKPYHKACLKCSHCQQQLTLGNYASLQGVLYCKPHFKQLFATKGNYDEGFGNKAARPASTFFNDDEEEKEETKPTTHETEPVHENKREEEHEVKPTPEVESAHYSVDSHDNEHEHEHDDHNHDHDHHSHDDHDHDHDHGHDHEHEHDHDDHSHEDKHEHSHDEEATPDQEEEEKAEESDE